MNEETTKKIRFCLLIQILEEVAVLSNNPLFNENKLFYEWIRGVKEEYLRKKRNFDELYNEVEEFTKSNYDLIQLFLLKKRTVQA